MPNWSANETGNFDNAANIETLLQERIKRARSIMSVTDALYKGFLGQVADALMHIPGHEEDTIPDYSMLDRTHADFDVAAQAVEDRLDAWYNKDNPISPLRELAATGNLDLTSQAIIEHIYFAGKQDIMEAIGRDDFIEVVAAVQERDLKQVAKLINQVATVGYKPRQHGDNALQFLKSAVPASVDPARLNDDELRQNAGEMMRRYVAKAGELKKSDYNPYII